MWTSIYDSDYEKRAWCRSKRVGNTEHGTSCVNSFVALQNHTDNRAGSHVLDETREERFALVLGVVWIRILESSSLKSKMKFTVLKVLRGRVYEF